MPTVLRRCGRHEVVERSPEPARELRGVQTHLANLVESQGDVAVPVQRRHTKRTLPVLILVLAGGKRPGGELAEEVVEPVDGSDCGGGVS